MRVLVRICWMGMSIDSLEEKGGGEGDHHLHHHRRLKLTHHNLSNVKDMTDVLQDRKEGNLQAI